MLANIKKKLDKKKDETEEIKKKKKENAQAKKNFEELLYWKKGFREILKEKDNPDSLISEKELILRFNYAEKKLSAAESNMIDVKRGLYLGISYELGKQTNVPPLPLYAKWKNLNNHVGFKGTTRVGKTVNMQGHIEQCIANNWDVIIIDPKGGERQEILSSTAESCHKYGRSDEMMYYSPAFEDLSHKINTLYGRSNLEIASMIIDAIAEPGMESFYLEIGTRILLAETTAFQYLQAITDPDGVITRKLEEDEIRKYHEYVNVSSENDEYNLKHKDIIEKLAFNDEDYAKLDELTSIGFNRTLLTYKDLENFCSHTGLTNLRKFVEFMPLHEKINYDNKKIEKLKNEAMRVLDSALKTDITHFSKVSDTLANRLLQLSIGPIGDMLCGTRINPLANRLMREDKGVVAVVQPYPMKYKKSSKMFNKALLGMLDSMMGSVGAEGRGLKRRIAVFIDEAGAIAYPGIENFFNRAGGLGISCFVYTQSDEDYKEALGETLANVVMDNVNTKGIMRQNFRRSAEDAAEDIGTIKTHKTVAMISAGGSDGRYTSDVKDELLCSKDDIQTLPMGEGIITHDGKRYYVEFPYRAKTSGAFKMPELESEKAQRHLIEFEKRLEQARDLEANFSNIDEAS